MVSTTHPVATKIGLEIIKQGGNAFDAAIAVQFALSVVYPRAGNIGGGGFMVYRLNDGESGALDFREKASINASNNMYIQSNGYINTNLSLNGIFAAATPGTVDGMVKVHEKFSKTNWAKLVQPSINLAKNGVPLNKSEAFELNKYQALFKKMNRWEIPAIKEKLWQEGDSIKFKDLAKTLSLIRDKKRKGFYNGLTAKHLLEEMKLQGGIICQQDLDEYEAKWRKPIYWNFRKHRIITMPPPSSGGLALCQLLFGWESYFKAEWGHNSPESIHLMTELERYVFADRCTYLGDPDFVDLPMKTLIDKRYLKQRYANISYSTKEDSQKIKKGESSTIESIETTHFSIVDTEGNAVGVTTTLNSYYGCKVMVKGAGFFLNNEMNDFCLCPGTANQFGLVESDANIIQAKKRMLSCMSPTIIEKENKLFMLVGTPGGSTIITNIFQTIVNVIDFNMNMKEAVEAAKTHSQWLPDEVLLEENRFSENTLKELEKFGHHLKLVPKLGKMDCILVRPDGNLEGASDSRGEGLAEGF